MRSARDDEQRMKRELRIEWGRLWLTAADARRLRPGSRIELESGPGAAASVWAGGRRVASGEAVVRDGRLCVRVDEVLTNPVAEAVAGAAAPAGGTD